MKYCRNEKMRFEYYVIKTDSCWLWNGCKLPSGYGRLSYRGKVRLAHVVSWLIYRGNIIKLPGADYRGTCVCHKCDVKGCVNPAHLFLGTHRDNLNDMIKKGRSRHKSMPRVKITVEQVKIIKKSTLKINELCRKYKVCRSTIFRIRAGKSDWRLLKNV